MDNDRTTDQPTPAAATTGPAYAAPTPPLDLGLHTQMQQHEVHGAAGPIGKVRPTGTAMLLYVVTFGIYGLVWYYKTHDEMKRHSGQGLGGGVALLLGFFVAIVMVFLTPGEVGKLYERRGQKAPVSAVTGLWILLPLVGAIIWFVKTNDALNAYWRSLGAS